MNSSGLVVRTWNDAPISRRDSDGYADATAMCQANGKLWGHYQRLDQTKAYIQALADATGLLADQLIISTTNGPNHLRGTWIHPRLAVDLARWLSPAFAVWMDGWFLEQLHYNPATNVDSFRRAKQHAETLFAKLNAGSSRPVIRQRQVQSLNELAPCECLAMQYVAWRHWTQQPCETMHVIEVLQVRWKWSTIRNRLGTLRERGLITKEGRSWIPTELGDTLSRKHEDHLAIHVLRGELGDPAVIVPPSEL